MRNGYVLTSISRTIIHMHRLMSDAGGKHKGQEKLYRVADGRLVPSHPCTRCISDFGQASFEAELLPFLVALHARRGSIVSSSALIELYAESDRRKAESRTIVDFMAARDRLARCGVLVEVASESASLNED
jgi:hypothetical protein